MRTLSFDEAASLIAGTKLAHAIQEDASFPDELHSYISGERRERLKRGELEPAEDVEALAPSMSLGERDTIIALGLNPEADHPKRLAAAYVYAQGIAARAQ